MAHVELYDGCDMGQFQEGWLNAATVTRRDSGGVSFSFGPGQNVMTLTGQGLTFGGAAGSLMTGGVVTSMTFTSALGSVSVTGAHASAATMGQAYVNNDTRISEGELLSGDDDFHVVDGRAPNTNPDHTYFANGYAGNDLMVGGGSLTTFFGGTGADTLQAATAAAGVLSGDDGDDSLAGGAGADTLAGGAGHDVFTGGDGADLFILAPGDSGVTPGQMDSITDWQVSDHLILTRAGGLAGNYVESTATSFSAAQTFANGQIAGGVIDFVAVSVGGDVIVFADSRGDNGGADDAVLLSGRTLADISQANILAGPPLSTTAEPAIPVSPATPVTPSADISISGTLDQTRAGDLANAQVTAATGTLIQLVGGSFTESVTGSGFVYDGGGDLIGGSVTGVNLVQKIGGVTVFNFIASFPAKSISFLAQLDAVTDPNQAFQLVFGSTPKIAGSIGDEEVHGGAGQDVIFGGGGHDSLFGGLGGDVIFATAPWGQANTAATSSGYLRGEDGNDYIVGNAGFDDINGNMGNDTGMGGLGDDWVVGGKDNDLLFGESGDDIVYGNLGDDSCVGGVGADLIRGGQGSDQLWGGDGADWMSGDRGDDTLAGGAGADTFHTFGDAGVDRVLDFNVFEGDKVQLDPGTQWTVAQVGADTVISMTGGAQMILVGVQMSTLPTGWIFGA